MTCSTWYFKLVLEFTQVHVDRINYHIAGQMVTSTAYIVYTTKLSYKSITYLLSVTDKPLTLI